MNYTYKAHKMDRIVKMNGTSTARQTIRKKKEMKRMNEAKAQAMAMGKSIEARKPQPKSTK